MGLIAALQALAATGVFASRAFTPLFVLAAIARWPAIVAWIPFVPEQPLRLPEGLAWLASDPMLAALAVLSALELAAERSAEARELLSLAEPLVKAAAAVVGVLALGSPEGRVLLDTVAGGSLLLALPAGAGTLHALHALHWALALGVGAVVFTLARWRLRLLEDARRIDADSEVHLARLLAWLEHGWAVLGITLVLLAPVLALLLSVTGIALLAAAVRAADRRANARRLACPSCEALALPEASRCPACAGALRPAAPASSRAWPDRWLPTGRSGEIDWRAAELAAGARCPACAEKRDARDVAAGTPHDCGWPAGDVPAPGTAEIVAHVRARAIRLAIVSGLLGIVPVLGAVVALVAGRLRVAAPLARLAGPARRHAARWGARLLILLVFLGSGLPLASALTGPLIVAILHATHARAALRGD